MSDRAHNCVCVGLSVSVYSVSSACLHVICLTLYFKGIVGEILLNHLPLRGFTIFCLDMKPGFIKRLVNWIWKDRFTLVHFSPLINPPFYSETGIYSFDLWHLSAYTSILVQSILSYFPISIMMCQILPDDVQIYFSFNLLFDRVSD